MAQRPPSKSAFQDATSSVAEFKNALFSGENISTIPLSLIYSPKTHDRKCYTDSEINELAASIKKSGLLQPIVVRKVGDKFERLIGFKRILAVKLNNEQSIKAMVLENIDDKEAALITISENLFRSDPNAYDQTLAFLDYASIALNMQSEQIKKLLNRKKASIELDEAEQEKLSLLTELLRDSLSITISTFMDKLRVLSLNPLLIEAIQKREIPYTAALVLNSIKDDKQLSEVLKKVTAENLSLVDIKQLSELRTDDKEEEGKGDELLHAQLLSSKYKRSISKLSGDKRDEINRYLHKIEEILKNETHTK